MVIAKPRKTEEVSVVYMATFGGRASLPAAIDPNFWVPVQPAGRGKENRGSYDPISSVNGIAQWVSIRKHIVLGEGEVSNHL